MDVESTPVIGVDVEGPRLPSEGGPPGDGVPPSSSPKSSGTCS